MIELVNNTTQILRVNDLGIELKPSEKLDIENVNEKNILQSNDLKTTLLTFELDGVGITYDEMIKHIKRLNHFDHIAEDTHAHNIRDDSFFDTEKVGGLTNKITYYHDSAKTQKIREEEIIRVGGAVSQIKSTVYDDNENIVEIETQTLNRDGAGKVESITTSIED